VHEARKRMPEFLSRLEWTQDQVQAYQLERLRKIAKYARDHSAFWRDRFEKASFPEDLGQLNFEMFKRLPILTKSQVMDNWQEICTFDEKSRPKDVKNYSTGGSSGRRGTFCLNEEMFINGGCAAFRLLAVDESKDSQLFGNTLVVISASTDPAMSKHASTPLFTHIAAAFPPEDNDLHFIQADMRLHELLERIERLQPTHIVGYASVVEEIALACQNGKITLDPPPRFVTTNSEPLTDTAKQAAKAAWNLEIMNSCGSTEGLLFAIQGQSTKGGMVLNEDIDIFEFLDTNGEVVETGLTESVALTPLLTLEPPLPLFRYVVEDKMRVSPPGSAAKGFRVIDEIFGRADEYFTYDSDSAPSGTLKVHPISFRRVLGQSSLIQEYQVQQTKNGAIVRVVTSNEEQFNKGELANVQQALEEGLTELGLEKPDISISCVSFVGKKELSCKTVRFIKLVK